MNTKYSKDYGTKLCSNSLKGIFNPKAEIVVKGMNSGLADFLVHGQTIIYVTDQLAT